MHLLDIQREATVIWPFFESFFKFAEILIRLSIHTFQGKTRRNLHRLLFLFRQLAPTMVAEIKRCLNLLSTLWTKMNGSEKKSNKGEVGGGEKGTQKAVRAKSEKVLNIFLAYWMAAAIEYSIHLTLKKLPKL